MNERGRAWWLLRWKDGRLRVARSGGRNCTVLSFIDVFDSVAATVGIWHDTGR